MAPVLIITRPGQGAKRFAEQIGDALGHAPNAVFSPIMDIRPVPFSVPPVGGIGIFTSENGVKWAVKGGVTQNLDCYCVGTATTTTARAAGFKVLGFASDVAGLADLIIADNSRVSLTHFRGEHVAGDLIRRLNAAGLQAGQVICYDQRALPVTDQVISILHGENPVVLPLFSPRSATILKEQVSTTAPVWVIAISQAVADAAVGLATKGVDVAASPDIGAMVAATCRRLSALEPASRA